MPKEMRVPMSQSTNPNQQSVLLELLAPSANGDESFQSAKHRPVSQLRLGLGVMRWVTRDLSGQIISLPKGGGAQHGLGEKFSPDLHTGTR